MIVKIQRPLLRVEDLDPEMADDMKPMVYMYNKNRTFNQMLPYTEKWADLFGEDFRQYWLIETDNKRFAALVRQVPNEAW